MKLNLKSNAFFLSIKELFLILIIVISPFCNAVAQGLDALANPTIYVKITHPPGLGLKIDKVAFNLATGNCSDQIIDALISDFVNNDVEVIDRNNLEAILNEHDFNLSGYVDKNSAVSIGKIIGPSALLTVKVLRCQTEIKDNLYVDEKRYNAETKKYYIERAYIARTTVYLKASIQTTDLATGKIFSARVLEYSPTFENKSYKGKPEAPSEFETQEKAFSYLTNDVHKMFFSWQESVSLIFFNNKKGNLKEAFNALKAGSVDKAFEVSQKNLEFCKSSSEIKDKILAHAYYNMGIMHLLRDDYENTLMNLRESQKIRSGKVVSDAITKCEEAKKLSEEMQKVDEKAELVIQNNIKQSQEIQQTEKENTLTNADIISLTEKKLPVSLILQKIKTSTCSFDTSTDALIELSNAGVSEDVIMQMMEKN